MVKDEPSAEAAEKPSPPEFVFGVDLDGVCVDFYGAIREIAAEWTGLPIEELTEEVTYGLREWNLDKLGGYTRLHRFAVTQGNSLQKRHRFLVRLPDSAELPQSLTFAFESSRTDFSSALPS